ncbi:restriction endonuclease subunit S [Hymenobacter humi]|uniref:Restriction endonuclease subunit S n=1 Tax=Hymenobacter humi TaxID=1411620 RepID=A0ABW2UA66_9BACT
MERYEVYKPTGIEWMQEVPSGWGFSRLKHIADINAKTLPETTDETYTFRYLDIGNVTLGNIDYAGDTTTFKESPSRARRIVGKGDILISTVRTYLKAIAQVEVEISDLVASTGFATLTARSEVDKRFLFYLIINQGFVDTISAFSTGVSYPAITATELGNMPVWFPISVEEQRSIVRFLDDKTAQVDQLITQKQQMVALLQEERAALIDHAVTKGLNASAPLRDSGIDWLGKVPAHWEVKRLKNVCRLQGRVGFKGYQVSDLVGPGEGALTVGGKHIRNNIMDVSNPDYISWEKYYESPEIMIEVGDVIVAQRGTLGKVAYVKELSGPATINPSLILLKDSTIHGEFLYWYLRSNYVLKIVDMLNTSTAVPMLSQAQFSEFKILVPPDAEQRYIVERICAKEASISETVSTINKEINLLQEYRAALIAEAVTGQVDVRQYEPAASITAELFG